MVNKLQSLNILVLVFGVVLSIFEAKAVIYELPMDLSQADKPYRVLKEFPPAEGIKIYSFSGSDLSARVLSLGLEKGQFVSQGSSSLSRFISIEQSQFACEDLFASQQIVNQTVSLFESANEQIWNSIDSQALSTMASRDYLDKNQWSFYLQSSNQQTPEQMFYIESYTWIRADQIEEFFSMDFAEDNSSTPWHLFSAIETSEEMTPGELREAIIRRDKSIRLRIRRATIRVVADLAVKDSGMGVQRYPLPFSLEDEIRSVYTPQGPYNYEFGRLSQLPGFESEGKILSGLATLVASHHSFFMSRAKNGVAPSFTEILNSEGVKIYIHSLEKRHTILYRRAAKAEVVPEVSEPNNTLLFASLPDFIGAHKDILDLFRYYEELASEIQKAITHLTYGESLLLAYYWTWTGTEATQFNYLFRPRKMLRGDQISGSPVIIDAGLYYHGFEFKGPIKYQLLGKLKEQVLRQMLNRQFKDVQGSDKQGEIENLVEYFLSQNNTTRALAPSVIISHPGLRINGESRGNIRKIAMEYIAHLIIGLHKELKHSIGDGVDQEMLASIILQVKNPPSFFTSFMEQFGLGVEESTLSFSINSFPESFRGPLISFIERIDKEGVYEPVDSYEDIIEGLFPAPSF